MREIKKYMTRYISRRSPYPDTIQARAIELLRSVDSGQLQVNDMLSILAEDFPSNKRLEEGQLTIKVVRKWAKARPTLPEDIRRLGALKGLEPISLEIVTTFEEVIYRETVRGMIQQMMTTVFDAVVLPYEMFS